jgi:hypothetical protein
MIRVNHARAARQSRKQDGRQNILRGDELLNFLNLKKPRFHENFETNFEKCCHQYSKRYMILKKSHDTCVNPKIKHCVHEGMCMASFTFSTWRLRSWDSPKYYPQ